MDQFLDLPDLTRFIHVTLRLVVAALLGGLLGAERESSGKAAGLRTHMLVAAGSSRAWRRASASWARARY
jgi:putative Mg2+ transporter-C (MgtC) family protein